MTFPLMPINAAPLRSAPVWSAQVGAASTTGDGFVGGTITLTATTTSRLLVLFYMIGNVGGRISTITIGGSTPTNVAQVDGYYIWTLPVNTSGSALTVSGSYSTSGGRSVWRAWELSGYVSATPAITQSAASASPVASWSALTTSNMATGAVFDGTSTLTVSAGSTPSVTATSLEGATYNHAIQAATARGPVTYTPGATTRYLFAAWR